MNCELSSIFPDDLYIICASDALIKPDDVSSTFPTMAGWKIRVIRGGIPLWLTNPDDGDSYFDYTPITGEATWSSKPAATEKFIIQAYKPA